MAFDPIAIVGQACVLPGALDPAALWNAVLDGRDLLSRVPAERWRLSPRHALGEVAAATDRTWSDRGGYVAGFDGLFDPTGFALPPDEVRALDPLFQWTLHCGRAALGELSTARARTGAILGNLSFPSVSLAQHAARVWLGDELADGAGVPRVHPRNRFMSGLPAHLLAHALGLGAGAFALDAACASSLYAIKLACDWLHDGTADLMLAGAVNGADDLFIHIGFCALQALSQSGQSRPFHRAADGLVPAEGAALVALKRLDDAERDGDPVLGVIRGVGIGNDGRGHGLLAPSAHGQVRAMADAYRIAGLRPDQVTLIECHATGTPVGDATEARSLRQIFDGSRDLPIGSLKGNLGHLITVAGVAGLLKVLGALQHAVRPPTRHADSPIAELTGSSLRLLTAAEPWRSDGPRRAAVSAFGFGGNNAHLLVEEYRGPRVHGVPAAAAMPSRSAATAEVAIVALAVTAGDCDDVAAFGRALAAEPHAGLEQRRLSTFRIALRDLRFPPADLAQALPQQLLMLKVARDALADVKTLPRERTGIFVGMGCDPEVARYGLRWRLAEWAPRWGVRDAEWLKTARDRVVLPLQAAGVVGTMPNIPANRLSNQFEVGGPSFTVASEQLSGLRALQVAARALREHELDAALVGAVDLSCEPVHEAALAGLGLPVATGDAAIALVLKRRADAQRDGDRVLAVLGAGDGPVLQFDGAVLHKRFGQAHAASGLLQVAAALLTCQRGAQRSARIEVAALEGQRATVELCLAAGAVELPETPAEVGRASPLEVAAHAAPVCLPELPGDEIDAAMVWIAPLRAEQDRWQTMRPAPPLPPVFDDDGCAVGEPTPVPSLVVPVHAAHTDPALSTLAAGLLATRTQVAHLHQQFLAQQAQVQQRFVRLRQSALQTLLQARPRPRPPSARPSLPGLNFDREALKIHASGAISSLFGPHFAPQDGFARQVRMPEPPLLLADRVTGLDAEAGSMGRGTIWTETDVGRDAWYLHQDRVPAGIMVEAGQADLMLISYLGVDLLNRGQRVYRLLGCELTFHGPLARSGDRLCYDIHVDDHAKQGEVRLFFFHSDCRVDGQVRLSVRNGQAGFFSDAELVNSGGVLWDAGQERPESARVDEPRVRCTRHTFGPEQLRAWAAGDAARCFGPGFERGHTHTRTPRIADGRMLLLDRVTDFDPRGGPWGRGYLRAVDTIASDDWFFGGHFKGDPCMPGTLMLEGCLQAMAVYLGALGYTLEKDGWLFEPVPDLTCRLRCRGQVTPASRELVYEVFVSELHAGPLPTLYADLLCTVDGLKAFHCQRLGLRLAPAWPLDSRPELLVDDAKNEQVAVVDGMRFGQASLLACAWGRPSDAFGPAFRVFDGPRRVARLPGPPYHFMSRVSQVDGPAGQRQPGITVEVVYDVPRDGWYFAAGTGGVMPFCVLLEAALQPCGWLACYVGSTLGRDQDLAFRNLDGTGTLLGEIGPAAGTLRTRARLTGISESSGMLIESFDVVCLLGDRPVYTMQTVFGFFPPAALAQQVGLSVSDVQRAALDAESDFFVDLTTSPDRYCAGPLRLPTPFLRMIDRVTGWWPKNDVAPLPRLRSELDVKAEHWSFKAHFFQDPVQPGSLGIEAMIQLLQFAMIHRGQADGMVRPRFEPLALARSLTWKYRGQVVPEDRRVTIMLDLVEEGRDARGPFAVAEASLWVDGRRIYQASDLGLRVVETASGDEQLDPQRDRWLADHRPTWTVPALPLMCIVDRLAAAVPGPVIGLREVAARTWLTLPGPRALRTRVDGNTVTLLAARLEDAAGGFEEIACGQVLTGDYPSAPVPLPPLAGEPVPDPYASGALFHGPAFQLLRSLRVGADGASAVLDASPGVVPPGILRPALLDAATHAIPHDALHRWSDQISDDVIAYPVRIPSLDLFRPAPDSGQVRCEVRFDGFYAGPSFPAFRIQLSDQRGVWAELRLVEACFAKGALGRAAPAQRRAFLRDHRFVPGLALSRVGDDETRLRVDDVRRSDWLPGTIAGVYGSDDAESIALKEHVAAQVGVHPRWIPEALPLNRSAATSQRQGDQVVVRGPAIGPLDLTSVREYWSRRIGIGPWPVEDLYYGLVERFVRSVVVEDPAALAAVHGRSLLYLANHQVAIESLLFAVLSSGLTGRPTVTLAKAEHRHSWLGQLIRHSFAYPGVRDPGVITFFDREERDALPRITAELGADMTGAGKSALVHVEGTRALDCRSPVAKMSGLFIDLALHVDAPIVPVRFAGGLPVEPLPVRSEFPLTMGRQEYFIGRPLLPEELRGLPYKERKQRVIDAINALGPARAEHPNPGNPAFAASVEDWVAQSGASTEHAVLLRVLQALPAPSAQIGRLLDWLRAGRIGSADDDSGRWLAVLARWLLGPRSC